MHIRAALLITAFSAACIFAAPAGAQDDSAKVQIKVEQLAPGVAALFGSGGNIGLSYGEDGNIIIDDQFAPLTDKISAAIATLDPDPVRFIINTHWHGDHTGGNENFAGKGAVIVAQDNVRKRMSIERVIDNQTQPARPKAALPVVTFADSISFHLNDDTLHVTHVEHAHTDGDALIYWEKADVLHMGDTFFNGGTFPYIDLESGGSIDGAIAAAARGLAIAGSQTRIIPGHGPVGSRDDLEKYRLMLIDIRDKVAAGIKAGRTLEAIKAEKPAARYGMENGFVKPDAFVETVYNSLRNPAQD